MSLMHAQMIRVTPPQKSLVHSRPRNLHRQICESRHSSAIRMPEISLDLSELHQSCSVSPHVRQTKALQTFKAFYSLQSSHLFPATVKSTLLHQIAPVLVEAVYNVSQPQMEDWKETNWEELLGREHFYQLDHLEQLVKELKSKRKHVHSQCQREIELRENLDVGLVTLRDRLQRLETEQKKLSLEADAEAVSVEKSEKKYASLIDHETRKREHCEYLVAKLKSYQDRGDDTMKIEAEANKNSQETLRRTEEKNRKEQLQQIQQAVLSDNQKLQEDKQIIESKLLKLDQQIALALCKKCSTDEERAGVEVKLAKLIECDQIKKRCLTPRPDWKRIVKDAPELKETTRNEKVDPNQLIFAVEQSHNFAEMISREYRSLNQAQDTSTYILGTDESVRALLVWIDYYTKRSTPELQLVWILNEIEKARAKLLYSQQQLDLSYNKYRELSGSPLDLDSLLEQEKQISVIPMGSSSERMTTILPNLEQRARHERTKIKPNYVTGLGVHEQVPRYLRHQGKVRVYHMEKATVDTFIRKVCTEKLDRDARYAGLHVSIEMALYERLYRKLGFQPRIAEFGYSLLLALNEYMWDSEIEMFLLCLTGTLSDQIYSDQEKMLRSCRQCLLNLSHDSAQSSQGELMLQDAIEALKSFFPRKTTIQFKDIEKAFIISLHDTSHDSVQVPFFINKVLPACDMDLMLFRSGALIKTLREQHFKEIQAHYGLLLDALKAEDHQCTGYLPFRAVVNIMCAIDPDASEDTTVKKMIQAMGIRSAKVLRESDQVHYQTLLQKMNQMMLMKHTRNYHASSPSSPRAS